MQTTQFKITQDIYSQSLGRFLKKGDKIKVSPDIGKAWVRKGQAVEIKSKKNGTG